MKALEGHNLPPEHRVRDCDRLMLATIGAGLASDAVVLEVRQNV